MLSTHSIRQQPVYFDAAVFAAAKQGDLSAVREHLEKCQGWIDAPNAKGNSMLSIAAKNGRIEVVTYLLEQGAQFYPNLKRKTVQDRATAEVRQLLETKKASRETTLERIKAKYAFAEFLELSPAIDTTEKQQKLDQLLHGSICSAHLEDILAFIDALDPSTTIIARKAFVAAAQLDNEHYFLNTFIPYHAFRSSSKDILACIGLFEKEADKTTVSRALAEKRLFCGDIELASHILSMMHPIYPERHLFAVEINSFSSLFDELNAHMVQNPHLFEQEIHAIFDTLDPSYLSTNLIECKSFDKAFLYARDLTSELRSVALTGLTRCHSLAEIGHKAFAHAQTALMEEMDKWHSQLSIHHETASHTQDYKPVLAFITSLPSPSFRYASTLLTSLEMCQRGLYEQSYALMQQEYALSSFMPRFFQETQQKIVDELLEKNEPGWIEQFLQLTNESSLMF